ncbi:hypothetical protein QUB56_10420 [Microcoleus sp. AR_TQ3_B6]|uniref:hypothetical protein n=1 Tax=Microcoleus sp. AR_TQ3_B6 TaxID=3055284 RepID=UPI002FD6DAE7
MNILPLCNFSVLTTEKLCAIDLMVKPSTSSGADNHGITAVKDKLISGKSVKIALS